MGSVTGAGFRADAALGGPMFSIGPPSGRSAGPPAARWYGESLEWCWKVERGLRHAHGHRVLTWLYEDCLSAGAPRVLAYTHAGLEVPGRRVPVSVRIEFHERPSYDTYGLAPRDYPRLVADQGLPSPHRMPDDSLCLYMPKDPEDRRWHSALGLQALFNLTRNHLYKEMRWRDTGGCDGGIWLGEEAPHGFTTNGRRVA